MARLALIADIHANYDAFQAVVRDIERNAIDRVVCLGDLVGYGPDPHKCIELAFDLCQTLVMGNHDEAVLKGPSHGLAMNQRAKSSIEITRTLLTPKHLHLLSTLPVLAEAEGVAITHGLFGPRKYDYLYDADAAARAFNCFKQRFGAVGHTHIPSIFTAPGTTPVFPDQVETKPVSGSTLVLLSEDHRLLVNPGSVGQPRDRDPNASWAILDTGDMTLEVRRVAYDVETTASKMKKLGLPDFHADRLKVGG